MQLRYGMNPHQPATIEPIRHGSSPFRVINGEPSYINVLDSLGAWQLVREAKSAFGLPAAASFKHVSPAGVALAGATDAAMDASYGLDGQAIGAVTSAYVRARDADPKSSFGDFVAISHPVDAELAALLKRLTCDGIIAPEYDEGVVTTLAAKKRGTFLILEADPEYQPPAEEVREIYGLRRYEVRHLVAAPPPRGSRRFQPTGPEAVRTHQPPDRLRRNRSAQSSGPRRLVVAADQRGDGVGRCDPVPGQHRPRPPPRSPIHRRARRLHPQRRSSPGLPGTRHRPNPDRNPPLPPLAVLLHNRSYGA